MNICPVGSPRSVWNPFRTEKAPDASAHWRAVSIRFALHAAYGRFQKARHLSGMRGDYYRLSFLVTQGRALPCEGVDTIGVKNHGNRGTVEPGSESVPG